MRLEALQGPKRVSERAGGLQPSSARLPRLREETWALVACSAVGVAKGRGKGPAEARPAVLLGLTSSAREATARQRFELRRRQWAFWWQRKAPSKGL